MLEVKSKPQTVRAAVLYDRCVCVCVCVCVCTHGYVYMSRRVSLYLMQDCVVGLRS